MLARISILLYILSLLLLSSASHSASYSKHISNASLIISSTSSSVPPHVLHPCIPYTLATHEPLDSPPLSHQRMTITYSSPCSPLSCIERGILHHLLLLLMFVTTLFVVYIWWRYTAAFFLAATAFFIFRRNPKTILRLQLLQAPRSTRNTDK